MFICVEGENCTGKSTLVAHLAKRLGWPVVKFSKPNGDPYEEYMKFFLTRKTPAILDRAYLGEEAYGKVWRGKSGLDGNKFRNIEDLLAMRLPVFIYCETSAKEIAKTFKSRGEELAKASEIPKILAEFHQAIGKSRFRWHQFDYRKDKDYAKLDEFVDKALQPYQTFYPLVHRLIDTRIRGDFFAHTLYVGERCNENLEPLELIMPFSSGRSGEFLQGILPPNVAMTNAYKSHDGGKPSGLADELMLPFLKRVVCLGNEAHAVIKGMLSDKFHQLDVVKMAHPAYATRFERQKLSTYKRRLVWLAMP